MTSMAKRVVVRKDQLTQRGALHTADVGEIVDVLRAGGFAMIPSDTCYSLAARPTQKGLCTRIDRILSRTEGSISLAFDDDNMERLREWVELNFFAIRIIELLTPGSLTLVCDAVPDVIPTLVSSEVLAAPDGTIGIRIPDSTIEKQLVSAVDSPLTTPAVRTLDKARNPVTDFEQARQIVENGLKSLGEDFPLALVEARDPFVVRASTVVRVYGRTYSGPYTVLREGAVTTDEIERAINRISRHELRGGMR